MYLKQNIKPETRLQLLLTLGPVAWLAMSLSTYLGRLENPDLDFITGFLAGFAVVGNIAFLVAITRNWKENRRQK